MTASTRIPLAAITRAGAAKWLLPGCKLVDETYDDVTGILVERGPRFTDEEHWKPQSAIAVGEGWLVYRPGFGLTAATGWDLDTTDPLVQTAACVLLLRLKAGGDEPDGMARAERFSDGSLDVDDESGGWTWSRQDVPALAACTTLAEALAAVVMWELERAGEGQ